ncbi:Rv3212 family protein [Saccharopolyspora cebuensis]|uniref:PQQ-like domain-containing protein n=1 Tax=Saccharopolyspora cebuensis TaxID=418759 RepID=A0ABV4CS61_9PSEU
MVRPERRRRSDLVTAVVLVVLVVAGGATLWLRSDARATVSDTAAEPLPELPAATDVPAALQEAWRAPSPVTPQPVVTDSAVVTGRGGEVLGHDPLTGEVRWRYARDLPLCTIGAEWDRALAVHRKSHNCSEVTSLRGATGERGPQRNSDAEFGTRLLGDGTYVTATGTESVETWRSDLVRTQQYGIPPALKNPDNNIERPECSYSSVAAGESRVAVVEECPREPGDRITVLEAKPEDDEEPEVLLTRALGGEHASVVAVTETRVAVAERDRGEVVVYNFGGIVTGSFPVRFGEPDTSGNVTVERVDTGDGERSRLFWHTGVDTVALDPLNLMPVWTAPDALGPGVDHGGHRLVPVPGGLLVLDPVNGARQGFLPVDRGDHRGPVRLSPVGQVLLEQRGDTLVALRPR